MIAINLLNAQLTYASGLIKSRYIIVNARVKGSLSCPECEKTHKFEPPNYCVHLRRVPIVSVAERLSL